MPALTPTFLKPPTFNRPAVFSKPPTFSRPVRYGGDANVAAFQSYGVGLGETPLSPEVIAGLNQFVGAMKINGQWARSTAIYPIVGGTTPWFSLNLKDPTTFRMIQNGTVVNNANGTQGNGVNGYWDTGFDRATSSQGFVCAYSRTNVGAAADQRDWGQVDGSGSQWACEAWDGAGSATGYWGGVFFMTVDNSLGFYLCGQDAGDSNYISKNGSVPTGDFGGTSVPEGNTLFFMANNNNGVMDLPSSRQYSFFAFGNVYATGDEVAFNECVQALQSGLGRQV